MSVTIMTATNVLDKLVIYPVEVHPAVVVLMVIAATETTVISVLLQFVAQVQAAIDALISKEDHARGLHNAMN